MPHRVFRGGKSTIAKLISGFYPVDGGEILIGGKNIQSYSEKSSHSEHRICFPAQSITKDLNLRKCPNRKSSGNTAADYGCT